MTGTQLERTLKDLEKDLIHADRSDRQDAVVWLRSLIVDVTPARETEERDEDESDMDLLFDNVPL